MIFMKKLFSAAVFCSFCCAALAAPFSTLSASAETNADDSYKALLLEQDNEQFGNAILSSSYSSTTPYKFILQPERNFVSSEELAQGDVHIPTKIYIQGDNTIGMSSFLLSYTASDINHIYFDNSVNMQGYVEKQTYEEGLYSVGAFSTTYPLFCFGKIGKGKFLANGSSTIGAALIEPRNGGEIYSDGNGGIYFSRSYNKMVDGVKTWIEGEKVEIPADQIQVLPNGRATFSYIYYLQEEALGFPERTNTFEIPYYDPSLAAGTLLKGENDVCYWTKDNGNLAPFFGYADEFPCFAFDIVLRQGTPNGTYTVSLDEDYCRLRTTSGLLPLQYVNTTITVGTASATVTEDKTSPYYCFFAENDMEIRLNQASGELISEVTYEDGTTDTSAVEAAATCGQSPADLYAQQTNGTYIDEVAFSLDSQPLQQADGTAYTKKLLIGKKGDANLDGKVDVDDAVAVLQYYAQKAAGLQPSMNESFTEEQNILSYFLADIDTCSQNQGADGGALSVEDAVQILTYYAQQSAGLEPTWQNR